MVINHQMGDTTRLVDIHNRPRWGGSMYVCVCTYVRGKGQKNSRPGMVKEKSTSTARQMVIEIDQVNRLIRQ